MAELPTRVSLRGTAVEMAELPNQCSSVFLFKRGFTLMRTQMTASPGERGAVLGMVIVIAVTTAIGAYTLLFMAASQARQAQAAGVNVQHTQARYAAEGGLVWAQQRLWATPTSSFALNPDTTIGGMGVDVTVSPVCGATPCPPQTLQATVDY